jgi:hypothetical protein
MSAARAHEGRMFVGVWVWHAGLKEWSWDVDYVWIDEDTGEIDVECQAGWDLDDYEAWMPVDIPSPPSAKPIHEPKSDILTA